MNNVELRTDTKVGVDCYIDSGVKSSGRNRVGDRVVLRYDSIIARGCDVGDDAYICPQVMTNNLNHLREEVGGAHVGKGAFVGTERDDGGRDQDRRWRRDRLQGLRDGGTARWRTVLVGMPARLEGVIPTGQR